jgi:homoserine dehydrogenase
MKPDGDSLEPLRKAARLCVLKFGGSVLTNLSAYAEAAAETYRHIRSGEKTIVIVSALHGETDGLYDEAEKVGAGCSPEARARLVRLGEFRSAALMGLALERIGVRAAVVDPHEIGLYAEGDPLDADLCGLDVNRLAEKVEQADAVIVPGFTASHAEAGAAVLGRGGTDLTAVVFAAKSGAQRVRLIKDVDGVYTDDPAKNPNAGRYDRLDYAAALKASNGLIQDKAIRAAEADGVVLEVAAMGAAEATRVLPGPAVIGAARGRRRQRVALLGCGSVGSGVLDHVRQRRDLFAMNPVLVRHPEMRAGDRRANFTSQGAEALAGGPDLLVEMMGGADEPAALMADALEAGVHVVTANKAAVAKHFDKLHAAARRGGARFEYSAAVGGGAPMIETVRRLQPVGISAVEGVMNGTANFILSKLGQGEAFEDALNEAQRLGFAEADPSADVDGHDAADKLSILIREAFGVALPPERIAKQSLSEITPEMCASAAEEGKVYKQIARARRVAGGAVDAEISIEPVALSHPFAGARNEQNRALVTDSQGRVHAVYGKGAGRWPTAAAVFADMMDIQRASACDGAPASVSPRRSSDEPSRPRLQQA